MIARVTKNRIPSLVDEIYRYIKKIAKSQREVDEVPLEWNQIKEKLRSPAIQKHITQELLEKITIAEKKDMIVGKKVNQAIKSMTKVCRNDHHKRDLSASSYRQKK